ncbi:MAG: hypothetical protein OEV55_01380 [candidate division Zixibacteria bacterium]|nr:hypothetical protein [candidate division Zixibacteria bacterium]
MEEKDKKVALKIFYDGKWKEVTFEELCLSNNLAQEALVTLLVKKKMIEPKELLQQMEEIRKNRYRTSEGGKE